MYELIGAVVCLVGLCGFMIYKGQYATVAKMVSELVYKAELDTNLQNGEVKYTYVVEQVYSNMPAFLQKIITPKQIDTLIEKEVQNLKNMLPKQ